MSDLYLVFCRIAASSSSSHKGGLSCIVVPKDTPGISFGQLEKKLGWRTQPTRQVYFDQVTVPITHRLGQEGEGFHLAMSGLNGARLSIAACSLGAAQSCLELTLQHIKQQQQHQTTIDQMTQFTLADAFGKLHTARLVLRQAADLLDQPQQSEEESQRASPASSYCALAKLLATEASSAICLETMQLLGTKGLLQSAEVERYYRDVRVHQILEGTNEIMRMIVGRALVA